MVRRDVGAPEFEVLRQRMRRHVGELELGRTRAIEAERAARCGRARAKWRTS